MGDLFRSILEAAKGLTLSNVLIIGLLILISFPAYVAYRVINEERLMNYVASSFEELRFGIGDCGVFRAQIRGEEPEYLVRYTFRFDRLGMWYLAIRGQTEPTKTEAKEKCAALAHTIEESRKAMGIRTGDVTR